MLLRRKTKRALLEKKASYDVPNLRTSFLTVTRKMACKPDLTQLISLLCYYHI